MQHILKICMIMWGLGLGAWTMEEKECLGLKKGFLNAQHQKSTKSTKNVGPNNTVTQNIKSAEVTVFHRASIWGFTAQELKEMPLVKDFEYFDLNFAQIRNTSVAEGTDLGPLFMMHLYCGTYKHLTTHVVRIVTQKGWNVHQVKLGKKVLCYLGQSNNGDQVMACDRTCWNSIVSEIKQGHVRGLALFNFLIASSKDFIKKTQSQCYFLPGLVPNQAYDMFSDMLRYHMSMIPAVYGNKCLDVFGAPYIKYYYLEQADASLMRTLWTTKTKQEYEKYCLNIFDKPSRIPRYPLCYFDNAQVRKQYPVYYKIYPAFCYPKVLPESYFQDGILTETTMLPVKGSVFMDHLVFIKECGLAPEIELEHLFHSHNAEPKIVLKGLEKLIQNTRYFGHNPLSVRGIVFCENLWSDARVHAVLNMYTALYHAAGHTTLGVNDFTVTLKYNGHGNVQFQNIGTNKTFQCLPYRWTCENKKGQSYVTLKSNNDAYIMLVPMKNSYKHIYRKDILMDVIRECFVLKAV